MRKHVSSLLLCGVLGLSQAQTAIACAFHGYTPNPTLVDQILFTEQVVLARLAPGDPGRYIPVETLMGPTVSEIAIPAHRTYRTQLQANPAKTVLLARDGAYGPWLELAVLDDRFRVVVDVVVQRQSEWQFGGDAARLRTFAGLVNDPDPAIRRLALQELDRAPYGALKSAPVPAIADLGQRLRNSDAALLPIHVLLAGLSKDNAHIPQLSQDLDKAVREGTPYLGAYVTALIELTGKSGVTHISEHYLQRADLSPITQERLLQALAIQYRAADGQTRRFIAQEVATLSRSIPGFKDVAARQFGFDPT